MSSFPYGGPLTPPPSWYRSSDWTGRGQKRNGVHYVGEPVEIFHPVPVSPTDVKTAHFARGFVGDNVTTSAGEASEVPWDVIYGAGPCVYDDAHVYDGILSAKWTGSRQLTWTQTTTDHYGRIYAYFSANPAINTRLIQSGTTSDTRALIFLRTSGALQISDGAGGHSATTGSNIALNQWIRIEWHIVNSATTGAMEVRFWNNPASTGAPDGTASGGGTWNTLGAPTEIRIQASDGSMTGWLDSIVSNAQTWVGVTNPEPAGEPRDYEVRNYYGEVVSSGSYTGTFFTPEPDAGGDWEPGWYRCYMTGAQTDPLFNNSYGVANFCVVRDFPGLVPMPTPAVNGGVFSEDHDLVMKGVMGMGTSRLSITDAANPTTAIDNIAKATVGANISSEYWYDPGPPYADPERPRYMWTNFPNAAYDVLFLPQSGGGVSWLQCFCKDGTLNGAQVFVALAAGTTGRKITVRFPDASTIVETFDNLTSAAVAEAVVNSTSNYIRVFDGTGNPTGTLAATAIGNAYFNGVVQVVQALYPLGVESYEGPENEALPDRITAHKMRLFQAAVHAGHPDAQAIGPCSVNIWPATLDQFFAAGGGDWCDGISVHAYNSITNADLNSGKYNLQAFIDLLEFYGQDDKPIWQTESTQALAVDYGVHHPRRARDQVMYQLLMEQYGIVRERNNAWYDVSHGFWGFPSWLENNDRSLQPQCVLSRVLAEETWGKPFASILDFGGRGNKLFIGSAYTGDAGTTIAMMATSYMPNASVTLQVTGTAGPVTVVTGLGVESSEVLTSGRVTVPLTDIPSYVQLPVGASAEVYSCNDWAPNPPDSFSPTATSKLLGGDSFPAIADDLYLRQYVGGTTSPGISTSLEVLPDTAELTFSDPVTVGRVIVWCAPAWQAGSTLWDFDVQTLSGGVWTTRKTVTVDEPVVFWHGVSSTNTGTQWETFWDEQYAFDIPLDEAVECDGVRLYARAASWGGEPRPWFLDLGYYIGLGENTQYIALQEIGVYEDAAGLNPPVVEVDPVASGTTVVGDVVSSTTGTWANSPTGYGYQWQSSANGTTGWADITGETLSTYEIESDQLGQYLRCVVTATNDDGSASASTNALGPVTNPTPPPTPAPSPGGSNLPGGTTVYLPRKRARKTGFKRRRM